MHGIGNQTKRAVRYTMTRRDLLLRVGLQHTSDKVLDLCGQGCMWRKSIFFCSGTPENFLDLQAADAYTTKRSPFSCKRMPVNHWNASETLPS